MMSSGLLESTGALLAVLTPLVVVPLTVITFYLRSLREHQVLWHEALVRRVELLEKAVTDLRKTLMNFEGDYTGKEEWLRECMHTRRVLEQLIEATARLETTVSSCRPNAEATLHRGLARRTERLGTHVQACGSDDPEKGNE